MEILRIILIVLCSVIAAALLLLLLVIFCRIKVEAVIGSENYIKVRFLFLRFKFSQKALSKKAGRQKKEKKLNKEKGEPPQSAAAEKEKNPSEIEEKLKNLSISDIFTIIDGVVQKFIKKLYFNLIMLNIEAATPEADKTALLYGELNAAIYPILGFIDAAGRLGKAKVNIIPDFTKTKTSVNAKIIASTRVMYLLSVLLYLKKENII